MAIIFNSAWRLSIIGNVTGFVLLRIHLRVLLFEFQMYYSIIHLLVSYYKLPFSCKHILLIIKVMLYGIACFVNLKEQFDVILTLVFLLLCF